MLEAFSDRTLSAIAEMERIRERLLQERNLGVLLDDLPSRQLLKALDEADRERNAFRQLVQSPLDQLRATDSLLRGPGFAERESLDQLQRTIEAAMPTQLPGALHGFSASVEELALRGLYLPRSAHLEEAATMAAFAESSAMARALYERERVDRELLRAVDQYRMGSLPALGSLHEYGRFLDAAGLVLPHWPTSVLVLRRKRLRRKLQASRPPQHVKRAKDLNHRYELVLRSVIDEAMAAHYGDDWAESRLVQCDCKDLLKKWQARGGEPLDHADFAHYKRIMTHPEHFSLVFAAGFDDPQELGVLVERAGNLRAACHHGRTFSEQDLRDLRVTWRTIENGIEFIIDPYGDEDPDA